jgi:hypothetical protein
MRRLVPVALSALLVSTALLGGSADASSHHTSTKAPTSKAVKHVKTNFALSSSGFGTSLAGGTLPTSSDTATGYRVMSCNVYAGKKKQNFVANATRPGLGRVAGVKSNLQTIKKGKTVSVVATHSVAKIVLAQSAIGSLAIAGVQSKAVASHSPSGFHTSTTASIAKIVLSPAVGNPVTLNIPAPGQTLTVPGLAAISLGRKVTTKDAHSASALAQALVVKVIPTNTKLVVAHSFARIAGGVVRGIYRGYGAATRVDALDGNLQVGRTPLSTMPCEGTHGKLETKKTAGVNLATLGQVGAATSSQIAGNKNGASYGQERGQVAGISLLGGQIKVDGVVAVASAIRTKQGLKLSSAGTQVLGLTVNGTPYDINTLQTIEIPGLAKIESNVVKKVHAGEEVVGLRITLLNGTVATVDLGVAKIQLRKNPA